MTRRPPEACAAFGGLAWAAAKHEVCLQAAGSESRAFRVLVHTPEASAAWVSTVRQRFKGQPLARGRELHQGPLVSALRKDDFRVLFPVNPLPLARDREAFAPSHAKDDPTDAELQLERRLNQRDKLTPLTPQSPALRPLAQLVAPRRRLVGANVRLTTRLRSTLKNYFPHVLQWLHDKDTAICCAVLPQGPTLKAAQRARRTPLERFFRAHHVRSADVIEQRLPAIKRATPLTCDAGVSVPHALLGQARVSQLRVTWHALETFAQAMAQHAQSQPDFPFLAAFPGAGAVLAPRLLVACGDPRDRYASADELQQEAGLAPVTARRGNTTWVHWRLQCPTCWRHTCVDWAAESTPHAFWARAYYQQQRHKGTSPQAAVRALAFNWIRLLLRCWQQRTPYDASVSLHALQRRASPLLHNLAQVV